MKKLILLSSMAALLVLAGCGGSDGTAATTPNPFQGNFSGSFNASNGQTGTATTQVGSNGAFTGQVHNATLSVDGSISGNIDNAGNVNGFYQYTGQSAVAMSGTWSLTSATPPHITGSLSSTVSGSATVTTGFDMTKQ